MREKLISIFSLSLCVVGFSLSTYAQHVPQTSYGLSASAPEWATLMYEHPEEVSAIRSGFEAWKKENPGVKDAHTQYYKRWQRQAQWEKPSISEEYMAKSREAKLMRNGQWTQMGPWHYDPEVAMYFEVQSPGACHVYTVEQAPSNADVVYAGTATAGMYLSTNKGLNWNLISGELPVTTVYSIAVDSEDSGMVWLGEGDGKL